MGKYSTAFIEPSIKIDSNISKRVYNTLIDPTIDLQDSDIYVITSIGERLDSLAWKYYNDATLWWIIAAANPTLRKDSLYLEAGIQIRIPADYQQVLLNFQLQNQSR